MATRSIAFRLNDKNREEMSTMELMQAFVRDFAKQSKEVIFRMWRVRFMTRLKYMKQ